MRQCSAALRCAALLHLAALAAFAAQTVLRPAQQTPWEGRDEVIRLAADTTLRWSDGAHTFVDLRGRAAVYQGPHAIQAPRLLVRCAAPRAEGAALLRLEVYRDTTPPPDLEGRRAARDHFPLTLLFTRAGLHMQGVENAGDAPRTDAFLRRGLEAFRRLDAGEGAEPPEDLAEDELQPSAEEMSAERISDDEWVATLHGNAEIAGADFLLSADTLRVRYKAGKPLSAYADGAVELQRAGARLTARAIYLDFESEHGVALEARVRVRAQNRPVAVQFYSDEVRQFSRYHFACTAPGFFSTSLFVDPLYRVQSRRIELTGAGGDMSGDLFDLAHGAGRLPDNVLLQASGNALYVGPVPLLYWPHLTRDSRSGGILIQRFEAGASSNLGVYAKAEWNLYDLGIVRNDWSTLTLRTDGFSERGPGVGLDFDYEVADRHGKASVYYVRDTARMDDRDLPTPRRDRGEVTWRHRETALPLGVTADLELGYLSDRNYLWTYDRDELDEEQDRETTLFLQRIWQNRVVTAQFTHRINDWQDVVERDAFALHVIGEPVFSTPLLWTMHTEAARLQRLFDDDFGLADPDGVLRLDSAHELSLPFALGPLRLDPYVWGDAAAFSETADNDGAEGRLAAAFGLRAASNFYRTFDVRSDILGIDRLRHVITPTLDYRNTFYVSEDPERFITHDRTDTLDESHRLIPGLRNRLQTYRYTGGKRDVVDLLVLDTDYVAEFKSASDDVHPYDQVRANLLWRINDHWRFHSDDNRFNVEREEFEHLIGAVTMDYWRPIVLTLAQDYYVDTNVAERPEHQVTRLTLSYRPGATRWRVDVSAGYDFLAERDTGDTRDPQRIESSVMVYRQVDDWQFAVGARFNTSRRNESAVSFRVVPPGFHPIDEPPSLR